MPRLLAAAAVACTALTAVGCAPMPPTPVESTNVGSPVTSPAPPAPGSDTATIDITVDGVAVPSDWLVGGTCVALSDGSTRFDVANGGDVLALTVSDDELEEHELVVDTVDYDLDDATVARDGDRYVIDAQAETEGQGAEATPDAAVHIEARCG